MRPTPYVGISGFTNRSEVYYALEELGRWETSYKLMAGILVSEKTLRGKRNKYPLRYPLFETVPFLFPEERECIGLIHYATDTSDEMELWRDLLYMTEECVDAQGFYGFQLNTPWPDKEVVRDWRKHFGSRQKTRTPTIVLQVGSRALERMKFSPEYTAKKLEEYHGVIDYALFDLSGGYGRVMDSSLLRTFLGETRRQCPTLGLGVAGGLSATTVEKALTDLTREFGDISCDAESALRSTEDEYLQARALDYLRAALKVCGAKPLKGPH